MDYIHAEDAQTNYIDIGPVNKALNMLAVWHADRCLESLRRAPSRARRLKQ